MFFRIKICGRCFVGLFHLKTGEEVYTASSSSVLHCGMLSRSVPTSVLATYTFMPFCSGGILWICLRKSGGIWKSTGLHWGAETLSIHCMWHCLWAATLQCLLCHDGCWWVIAWQANRLGVHAGRALPSSYTKEDVNLQTWGTEQCFSGELRPGSSKNASSV